MRAVQTWPYQGVPDNPAGWIYKAAHNLAIDIVRRDRTFSAKSEAIVAELSRSGTAAPEEAAFDEQIHDDELQMIYSGINGWNALTPDFISFVNADFERVWQPLKAGRNEIALAVTDNQIFGWGLAMKIL